MGWSATIFFDVFKDFREIHDFDQFFVFHLIFHDIPSIEVEIRSEVVPIQGVCTE